ncbi:NCS1 family transporter [Schnuerera ultunensis]|nr:NCS1 family transporter [Schnuerera ultunensis]
MAMENSTVHNEVITDKGIGEESLLPQEHRIMNNTSYLLTWLGGCVSIGTFMMGASLVPPAGSLNLLQALLAMIIGNTVIAIGLTINGRAGHQYGIPFIVQSRSSFGIKGSIVPGFIRAVPAVIWFGVQSWVGALAINNISIILFNYDNLVLFFIIFQVIQIIMSALGFKGIKWIENIGSVFILCSLIYMFYYINTNFQTVISEKLINIPGSWGLEFWGGTTAFLGIYTTMMLNVSDYMREFNKEAKPSIATIIHWLAIVPATLFMGLIGLMASGITGEWDPIILFTELIPNKFVLVLALMFIAISQITTNVLNNALPPSYVLMDIFKLPYRKSVIIVGLLSFLTFPWKITTQGAFMLFVQFYSAFLGPIFAVMVTDYYFVRKQKLDLELLYNEDGPYKDINWAGMIAICVGAVVALIEVQLSWYSSLIPAGLTYYLLMKSGKTSKSFLKGSNMG